MAEALFKERAASNDRNMEIGSAGVAALVGHAAADPVIELMNARGLDVSGHRARQLTTGLGRHYDLILVMEQGHRSFIARNWPELTNRVRCLGEFRDENIADPYGLSKRAYGVCLEDIEDCLDDWGEIVFG